MAMTDFILYGELNGEDWDKFVVIIGGARARSAWLCQIS
jgi:hypothetical protein